MARIEGFAVAVSVAFALAVSGCGKGGGSKRTVPAPSAPMGVSASSQDSGQVTVAWGPVTGATSYNLYWSTSPGVTKAENRFADVTSPFLHDSLVNGSAYYYVMTALLGTRESAESTQVSAMPLDAPTGLVAASVGAQVTLDWNPVLGATSYDVYWSTSPGVTRATGTPITGASPPYLHTGLTAGQIYYYVVTATNSVGGGAESTESLEVSALLVPAPIGVTATAGSTEVILDWNPAPGATTYNIYWSTERGVTRATGNQIPGVPPGYLHGGLTNGITLYYVVTASIAAGGGVESAQSAEVFATPDTIGVLDPSFNGQGWVTHSGTPGGGIDSGNDIALDSSNRILVAGVSDANPAGMSPNPDMAIWRFNSGGSIDTTFGAMGFVVYDNSNLDRVNALARDALERILVTGTTRAPSNQSGMAILRYDSTGALDTTFGAGGLVISDNAAGGIGTDIGYGIAVDASGRILVAGTSPNPDNSSDMVIWGYDSTGTLDMTFGSGGLAIYVGSGPFPSDEGFALTLDPSGRILATGRTLASIPTPSNNMALWRYDSTGMLDPTFGTGGVVSHDGAAGGGGNDFGQVVTVDPWGRILVAGYSDSTPTLNEDLAMAIWRYDATGTLDATFGTGGVAVDNDPVFVGSRDRPNGIVVDGFGRILVAGTANDPTGIDQRMVVWRFHSTGVLDRTFASGGIFVHDGGLLFATGQGITLDALGRILVVGSTADLFGGEMAIWRLK
ncbi:MAG: hypothetical protein O7H41_15025 [Planctomycetota bacterium]|nr:hypothetical protein [Planctomycetota bacterium]